MRRRGAFVSAFATLAMVVSSTAVASSTSPNVRSSISYVPVVEMFDLDGTPNGSTIGQSMLIRRPHSLHARNNVGDLQPGGVYTFWWVVIPEGGAFPDDAFVAGDGSRIVGPGGRVTMRMSARSGDPSISGFHVPFNPLDFDLETADVHVEIAYHGQSVDAGGNLATWRSDFWTGTACPASFGINVDYDGLSLGVDPEGNPSADYNVVAQPHCPVLIAAIHG